MFNILKVRYNQGSQAIPDVRIAVLDKNFHGLPELDQSKCGADCKQCSIVCPTGAISKNPLSIDMGKCVFCADCQRQCPSGAIVFNSYHKLSSASRETLVINSQTTLEKYKSIAVKPAHKLQNIFGRSLKLRQVSAGGCNGCEMELNACGNVNFDMGRFGIDFVASPRHADGLVITGPITKNMAAALEDTYKAVPEPKIIILAGTCAISGGVFANSKTLNRDFLADHKIDLYIPGCPIHPLTFINGVLDLLGIK